MANTYDRRINLYINGKEIKNNLASIQNEMFKSTNELRRMTIGTAEYNRKAAEVKKLKTIYAEHQQQLKATTSLMSKFGGLLPVLSGAAVIGGIKTLVTNMVNVRKEFEKYEAILTNSLGSQKAARTELRMLQEFASKTPYSLQELTGSFVKLTNYGLKPSREELVKYGDLASSVGKGFDQLTEALADAVTGEFERLKEFGIKAKKEGDKITFTFKEQATVVDYNAQSIKNYIQSLGDLQGVAGSMAAISKTVGGQISNMGDAWDNVLNKMGERTGGVMGFILSTITGTLNKISKSFEVLEADELSFFEKWMGSTVATDKMYNRMIARRNAAQAKEAQNAAAAAGVQNAFGVSTAGDINPTFVQNDKGKAKTPAQIAAEQKALEAATQLAEKQKKELDALTKNVKKDLIPEKDDPSQIEDWMTVDTWDIGSEKLEARKAREEEWTQFLKDQAELRIQAEEKSLEFEKQIADARMELKDMQVDAISQVASALAGMFEQGSAAQIAMIAVEKAIAIAQIWINYARQMSIINLAAEQLSLIPVVGPAMAMAYYVRNSAKAKTQAITNTGIVAALAIASGVSSGKRKKTEAYATGGYTNGAGMYIAGEEGKEWIAPNSMLTNPYTGPIIAALERQRMGPSHEAVKAFANGGYTNNSGNIDTSKLNSFAAGVLGQVMDQEQNKILKELANEIKELRKWKPAVAVETFERKKQQFDKINKTRGL